MIFPLEKRQNSISYGGTGSTTDSTYYWKEWAVFVAIIVSLLGALALIRWHGSKRIRENKRLLFFERFMFPRHARNGPPYDAPTTVALGSRPSAYGGGPSGVTAPPPTYDPYAQALPVYQAKSDSVEPGTNTTHVHTNVEEVQQQTRRGSVEGDDMDMARPVYANTLSRSEPRVQ